MSEQSMRIQTGRKRAEKVAAQLEVIVALCTGLTEDPLWMELITEKEKSALSFVASKLQKLANERKGRDEPHSASSRSRRSGCSDEARGREAA